MSIADQFLAEIQHEGANTVKLLAAIPNDQLDWQPHEKAFTSKALAKHMAEMFGWVPPTLQQDVLDFKTYNYKAPELNSTSDIVELSNQNIADAVDSLKGYPDDQMSVDWTMRDGDNVFFTQPRAAVLRGFILNHLYHHRGQLATYLRTMNARVPGIYGPTADDKNL